MDRPVDGPTLNYSDHHDSDPAEATDEQRERAGGGGRGERERGEKACRQPSWNGERVRLFRTKAFGVKTTPPYLLRADAAEVAAQRRRGERERESAYACVFVFLTQTCLS